MFFRAKLLLVFRGEICTIDFFFFLLASWGISTGNSDRPVTHCSKQQNCFGGRIKRSTFEPWKKNWLILCFFFGGDERLQSHAGIFFHKPCIILSYELRFFGWLWGIIILLVPTRGLRLAYAATVGAYSGTSCRKFACAAYARVVLFRRCLRGYSPGSFSPLVRWGLLDFMCVVFSSASSSSPLRPPRPQLRWCELSVPCRTSTAIVWAQCSLPDLNRDRVSSAFRAGPQPRSCVAQCASGDASWRGSAYWKTSWGERVLRGYNQIRLHLAYGYAYARLRKKPSTVLVFCCQFLLFTDVQDSTFMTS